MAYDIAGRQVMADPLGSYAKGRALKLAEQKAAQDGQVLEAQIANVKQAGQIASNQDQRAAADAEREEVKFGQEQQIANTKLLNAATAEVAQNPSPEVLERWMPQLKKAGVIAADFDPSSMDPQEIQQMAAELHQSTSAALEALSPSKPASVPTSYEEFALSQNDPAFAKFLKERKAKGGFSLTMPDGTQVTLGDVESVPADAIAKPIVNKLQETIVNSSNRLDRLNQTLATYNPEFLRAKGLAKALTTKAKDFVGMSLSKDEKSYLDEYSQFQSTAATDLSLFLNELSGAAISPQEYQRLANAAPSGKESSPTEFEGKAKATIKGVTRAMMRANWALQQGIGVKSVEQLSKIMPLEAIDQVYEQRANEIWQELGGSEQARKEAVRRANQEFGLAR